MPYQSGGIIINGYIAEDGGSPLTRVGVCYTADTLASDVSIGTIGASILDASLKLGSFTIQINDISVGFCTPVRTFASNIIGTTYSDLNFLTATSSETPFTAPPTVSTNNVTQIHASNASCGGNVIAEGSAPVSARGCVWASHTLPIVPSDPSTRNGTGAGQFQSFLSVLNGETTYYVRAYAVNSVGISYGDQKIFTTSAPEG